jgi:spore coat polysaccharide biosynthesis predicted glycosyltransferase SpsG
VNKAVLVRCDASQKLGLGHVVRCVALARVLRDNYGREVVFATLRDPLGVDLVEEAGFEVLPTTPSATKDYAGWLAQAVGGVQAGILVVDVRDGLTRWDLAQVRQRTGVRIALIDDGTERRLAADHAFYPPVPQAARLDWTGFEGTAHLGWEWALLRPEFGQEPARRPHEKVRVLVSMGGTDPKGLAPKVVRGLSLVSGPLDCTVVVGTTATDGPAARMLYDAIDSLPHKCIVVHHADMRTLMLESDLAVVAFGVTAFEAAACALPAIHLPIDEDHATSSSAFSGASIAVTLGRIDHVDEQRIAEVVGALLADGAGLRAMGSRARGLVDGKGASRIAKVLATEA